MHGTVCMSTVDHVGIEENQVVMESNNYQVNQNTHKHTHKEWVKSSRDKIYCCVSTMDYRFGPQYFVTYCAIMNTRKLKTCLCIFNCIPFLVLVATMAKQCDSGGINTIRFAGVSVCNSLNHCTLSVSGRGSWVSTWSRAAPRFYSMGIGAIYPQLGVYGNHAEVENVVHGLDSDYCAMAYASPHTLVVEEPIWCRVYFPLIISSPGDKNQESNVDPSLACIEKKFDLVYQLTCVLIELSLCLCFISGFLFQRLLSIIKEFCQHLADNSLYLQQMCQDSPRPLLPQTLSKAQREGPCRSGFHYHIRRLPLTRLASFPLTILLSITSAGIMTFYPHSYHIFTQ